MKKLLITLFIIFSLVLNVSFAVNLSVKAYNNLDSELVVTSSLKSGKHNGSKTVELSVTNENARIYYTISNNDYIIPTIDDTNLYSAPIELTASETTGNKFYYLTAFAEYNGKYSAIIQNNYEIIPECENVVLNKADSVTFSGGKVIENYNAKEVKYEAFINSVLNGKFKNVDESFSTVAGATVAIDLGGEYTINRFFYQSSAFFVHRVWLTHITNMKLEYSMNGSDWTNAYFNPNEMIENETTDILNSHPSAPDKWYSKYFEVRFSPVTARHIRFSSNNKNAYGHLYSNLSALMVFTGNYEWNSAPTTVNESLKVLSTDISSVNENFESEKKYTEVITELSTKYPNYNLKTIGGATNSLPITWTKGEFLEEDVEYGGAFTFYGYVENKNLTAGFVDLYNVAVIAYVTLPEKLDVRKLTKAINDYENMSLDTSKYTKTTVDNLNLSLRNAQNAIDNSSNYTQFQINDLLYIFNNSVKDLELRGDTTSLIELVNGCNDYTAETYTSNTWSSFSSSLEKAKEILKSDDANQNKVDEARLNLSNEISNLQIKANKQALQNKYNDAIKVNKDDFTPITVKELDLSMNKAKEVLDDPDAGQKTNDEVLNELSQALEKLVKKANKTELNNKIAEAEKLITLEDYYTAKTLDLLNKALEDAIKIRDDENVVDNQIPPVLNALLEKIEGLVKLGDKTELNKLISDLEKNVNNFTSKSWAKLEKTLNNSKNVQINSQADESTVEKTTKELNEAIKLLEKIGDKNKILEALKESFKKEEYTFISYNNYELTVTSANILLNYEEITEEEVEMMVNKIEEAKKSLAKLGNRELIKEKITEAQEKAKQDYSVESINSLNSEIAVAKEICNDNQATEEDVNKTIENLNKAINNLQTNKKGCKSSIDFNLIFATLLLCVMFGIKRKINAN